LKVTKLVLHNYKRLFLNGITHMVYTPESRVQIILGQNGSGKSSLLEQLTPLPPNLKKDFNEDGHKEITISHNSSIYILSSRADKGHSFIVNNTEINHSHKITMQVKLVEEHFNITPAIQQILLGKTLFTTMPPNDRKRWITDMSSIDYSYAIKVYNDLKARRRDIIGGIKLLQANIVKAKKSALPKEVISSLESDKSGIEKVVDYLFTLLDTTIIKDNNIDTCIFNIENLVSKLNATEDSGHYTIEELTSILDKLETKIEYVSEQLKSKYEELDVINRIDVTEDIGELNAELVSINNNIVAIQGNSRLPRLDSIEIVHDYINSNYSDIVSLLSPLSEYATAKVTNDHSIIVKDKLASAEYAYSRMTKRLYKLEERLAVIEKTDLTSKNIECPICGHNWDPNYDSKAFLAINLP